MMKSTYSIHEELRYEFRNNRTVLKERIEYLEHANTYVRNILSLINKSDSELSKINLDSILNGSLKYWNYNPANSTINELVSSGKLNLILDRGLKENPFKWLQSIEDADEDFKNQDQQATTLLIPYLYQHVSIKNLNAFDNIEIEGGSELFDNSYHQVFSDLEFENLYHGKLFWNTTMINHYKDLDSLAAKIIEQARIENLGGR